MFKYEQSNKSHLLSSLLGIQTPPKASPEKPSFQYQKKYTSKKNQKQNHSQNLMKMQQQFNLMIKKLQTSLETYHKRVDQLLEEEKIIHSENCVQHKFQHDNLKQRQIQINEVENWQEQCLSEIDKIASNNISKCSQQEKAVSQFQQQFIQKYQIIESEIAGYQNYLQILCRNYANNKNQLAQQMNYIKQGTISIKFQQKCNKIEANKFQDELNQILGTFIKQEQDSYQSIQQVISKKLDTSIS